MRGVYVKNKVIIIISILLVCSIVGITLYSSVFQDKKEVSDANDEKSNSLTQNIADDINNKDTNILNDDKEKREQVISKKLEKENNNKQLEKNTNNNSSEQQNNNYAHIDIQNDNFIENEEQNNYIQDNNNNGGTISDNNNNQPIQDNNSVGDSIDNSSNNSNNQTVTIPININDEAIDTDPNDDIYPTTDACNQVGIEVALKYPNDIINTFCFSYAENGKFLGYKLDINCKSGNCDKYK